MALSSLFSEGGDNKDFFAELEGAINLGGSASTCVLLAVTPCFCCVSLPLTFLLGFFWEHSPYPSTPYCAQLILADPPPMFHSYCVLNRRP